VVHLPRPARPRLPAAPTGPATLPGARRGARAGAPHVLVQFEDGARLVTINRRKSLRPLFAREQQLELGL